MGSDFIPIFAQNRCFCAFFTVYSLTDSSKNLNILLKLYNLIESTHRHNFVTCSCGCCSDDGGLDYLRCCFKNSQEEDYTELSETIETDMP